MPVDPSFILAHIDNTTPIYLPSSEVMRRQEALRKSSGKQAAGRIFSDYRSIQTGIGPGLDKPTDGLTYDVLRSIADTSPIDRVIIDTRIFQMKHVARRSLGQHQIGFAVKHVNHGDSGFTMPPGLDKLCRQIETVLATPTAAFHQSIRDFLTSAIEEELTIDRKAMVITRDRSSMRGKPVRFHLVDGATVKPVPAIVFDAIQKEYRDAGPERILTSADYDRTLYQLSELSGIDLYRAAYVQVVDANIVGAWTEDQMSIDITNPSVRLNQWGYGRSVLEKSWRVSDMFLKAWNYNGELFKLNYPEAVLGVIGDYDTDGLNAFKRIVLGEGTGQDNNWRLPVIPMPDDKSRIEMVKLRDTPKDMMFAEFLQSLIRLKTAFYRMHPSLVNFEQDTAAGTINFGQANEEQQIALSQEEGFRSILDSHADWLTRTIVKEYHEDLVMVWVGLDQETEDARMARLVQKVQNVITINEARAELGMKPLPTKLPTAPGDFVGSYDQAMQMIMGQQAQAQQTMQQGGQGYDDGDFGDPNSPDGQQAGGQAQPGDAGGQAQPMQQSGGIPPQSAAPGATPPAPQPQFGGEQHTDEEGDVLRRSLSPRIMRITVTE